MMKAKQKSEVHMHIQRPAPGQDVVCTPNALGKPVTVQ